MGIYTTKNQCMIENKSIKKNQITQKLYMPPEEIRNVSQSEQRNKGHAHTFASLAGRVSSTDTRRCPPADAGGMVGARENGHEGGR